MEIKAARICPSCAHTVLVCTSSIVLRTNGAYEEWTCPYCYNVFYQSLEMEEK